LGVKNIKQEVSSKTRLNLQKYLNNPWAQNPKKRGAKIGGEHH